VKWPGRFEWKILGVVLLVAGLSVGTAAYALSYALRGFLASSRQGGTEIVIAEAQALLRDYYAERKDEFHRRAELLARNRPAHLAQLADTPDLMAARLWRDGKIIDEWRAPPEASQRLHEAPRWCWNCPAQMRPRRRGSARRRDWSWSSAFPSSCTNASAI
jgi:hypothetical protein